MVCSLFGRYDATRIVLPNLVTFITDMINLYGVETFAITNYGRFSVLATEAFLKVKKEYPNIRCKVITTIHNKFPSTPETEDCFEVISFNLLNLLDISFAASTCASIALSFSDIVGVYNSTDFLNSAKKTRADIYVINHRKSAYQKYFE